MAGGLKERQGDRETERQRDRHGPDRQGPDKIRVQTGRGQTNRVEGDEHTKTYKSI